MSEDTDPLRPLEFAAGPEYTVAGPADDRLRSQAIDRRIEQLRERIAVFGSRKEKCPIRAHAVRQGGFHRLLDRRPWRRGRRDPDSGSHFAASIGCRTLRSFLVPSPRLGSPVPRSTPPS